MMHVLAVLLRDHDPWVFVQVTLEALLGSGLALRLLLCRRPATVRSATAAMLFGVVVALASWLAFLTALAGIYPKLSLAVPISSACPALAMSLLSGAVAGRIQQRGRRSARNAMLAGSLLACGFSCMLFTGMAGVVKPFMLAYDLSAVLAVMVLGAALCGFAFWESGNPIRRHPWVIATVLIATAILVLAFGSLGAILPFDAWLEAVDQPDQLASSPIAIIGAAESVVVLVLSLSGSLVDNRVAARDRLETDRLRQLADCTLEGILIHRDSEILDGNKSLAAMLGVELAELRASPMARFLVAAWHPERDALPIETEILAADGSRLPVEILSRSINYRGQPALVTALRDVRERRAAEHRIRFLAHHDMLTQLPNRVLLNESLDIALRQAARTRLPLAVLCLDLDGFKMVNDTLGHSAGDQLLCQVSQRLRDNLRESDIVARIGGDEFVVLQTTGVSVEHSGRLAGSLVDCLARSFRIDGQDVSIGASIGIAIHPDNGDTAGVLLKNSDIALYRAKKNGRGRFCLFESGMDHALQERRTMEQDLRNALHGNELSLQFQPVFDVARELVTFEALLRWTHPTLGPISPAQFIPLAEASGIIVPLGAWVMRTACVAAAAWTHGCRVAVNLSLAQLLSGDMRTTVATILAESGLPPDRLELEITEGVLMDNTESAVRILHELRGLAIHLVLDDFGTGYSSLSYLQRFPFDKLKIDRSFVQRLDSDAGSRAIVNAIIAMSHTLNLKVTAEGVETIEQFNLLRDQGCDEMQGFLIGVPIAQGAIGSYLRDLAIAAQPQNTGLPALADL